MRKQKPYYVLTFRTTAEAMAMEQKCGEQHIPGRLIPVPREITAGRGLACGSVCRSTGSIKPRLPDWVFPFSRSSG